MNAELMDYESEMNANEVLRILSDFEHEDERMRRLLRNMNTNICARHCENDSHWGRFTENPSKREAWCRQRRARRSQQA